MKKEETIKKIWLVQVWKHTEDSNRDGFKVVPCESEDAAKSLLFQMRALWMEENFGEVDEDNEYGMIIDADDEYRFAAHSSYSVYDYEIEVVEHDVLPMDRKDIVAKAKDIFGHEYDY